MASTAHLTVQARVRGLRAFTWSVALLARLHPLLGDRMTVALADLAAIAFLRIDYRAGSRWRRIGGRVRLRRTGVP